MIRRRLNSIGIVLSLTLLDDLVMNKANSLWLFPQTDPRSTSLDLISGVGIGALPRPQRPLVLRPASLPLPRVQYFGDSIIC